MQHKQVTDQMSPLTAIAAGPTQVIRTSKSQPGHGLIVEEHHSAPGARPDASIHWHVISMTVGQPAHFEYRHPSGCLATRLQRPGMMMVTPSGPMPPFRILTPATFIHCALEVEFTNKVGAELERPSNSVPVSQLGVRDGSMRRLITMLVEELFADAPSGRLYVDSLAHALASRLLLLDRPVLSRAKSKVSALPTSVLKRVKEKIEANLDGDLSLDSLAQESRYSRAHFIRMFQAATGSTPHQYVLSLRLKRAQEYLLQRGSDIIDVAISCGFSSQSHMTNLFKQHLEMTPAEFRRHG